MGLSFSVGRRAKSNASDEAQINAPAAKKSSKSGLKPVRRRSAFVLMVGDDGGILTFIEKGKVVRRVFAPSAEEQHLKPITEMLNASPKVPVYLLCDLMDQSYVRHSLPPVSSLSINKLVQRRLKRDFAPEDIKGALALGREKKGRKEWNYLLISLANSAALQQWLDPLLQMPNRFCGLYLVPVESQQFVKALTQVAVSDANAHESEWKILVAHDKVSGFRQVVLQNHQLVFTRLTQLSSDTPPEVMAGNIEQEVQNTIEYLRRMSFNDDAGLDVFIIIAQPVRDLIETNKLGATRVKAFSPYDAAKMLGLEQAALSGDRFSDVVLSANFAMRQKPQIKLLTAYAKKLQQLYMGIYGLRAVAILAGVAIAAQLLMALWGGWSMISENDDVQARLRSAQIELEDAEKRYALLDQDQEKVMRVAALHRAVPKDIESPFAFINTLASLKDSTIRLKEWSWSYGKEATPEAGKAPAKTPENGYFISMQVEFLDHRGDLRLLAQQADELTAALASQFESLKITRSLLPQERKKEGADQKIILDLDAPLEEQSFEVSPGDQIITFQLSGKEMRPKGGGNG